jgi:hypothetical protein
MPETYLWNTDTRPDKSDKGLVALKIGADQTCLVQELDMSGK